MLACTAVVGCNNEDDIVNNENQNKSGDNYVAVNLVMPNNVGSRAGEEFEDGTASETTVNDAVFLFLDGNYNGCADPCYVNGDALKEWSTNVTDPTMGGQLVSSAVLVIENNKQVPAYIVAVLNPVNGPQHGYTATTSLKNLEDEVATYTTYTESNFVMTNSVYVDVNSNKKVAATPIKVGHICSTANEAKEKPVRIPVERIVAKVSVVNLTEKAEAWENDDPVYGLDENSTLKLNVTGWEVLQNKMSYTIKNVNTAWSFNWWNASDIYRSYWAKDYTEAGRTEYFVDNMGNLEAKYVEETVNQAANGTDDNRNINPYLLVRGYFSYTDKDGKAQKIELVEWRGQKYTKDGYLNLIAGNSEISKYWYKDGDTYKQIDHTMLQLTDNESNDWQAAATLTTDASDKTYYTVKLNADGETVKEATEVTVAEGETHPLEEAIAKFGSVKYWNNGNTYYYIPIQHQIDGNDTYYGVVRNHSYRITISDIVGFGTPVSNPEQAIDEPEDPEDGATYLAAEVVVLKWKVVNQNATLGKSNN